MIHLIINQKALPKERARFNSKSRRTYTPSKTAKYESSIKMIAKTMIDEPFLGAVEVRVIFNFKKARSSKLTHVTKRPDIDNLLKGIFDALNKVAWIDDAQVVRVFTEKNFSSEDNIEITISEIK